MLALEWLVLGRAAYGEVVIGGNITDSWRVKKDGRLIWADSFRVIDETFPHLHRKALLSDCKAIATLVYFGPHLDKRLDFFREIIPSLGCIVRRPWSADLLSFALPRKSPRFEACRAAFYSNSDQSSAPDPFRYRRCGPVKDPAERRSL